MFLQTVNEASLRTDDQREVIGILSEALLEATAVTGAPAVELELHVSYRAGVFRPVALQKLALLL